MFFNRIQLGGDLIGIPEVIITHRSEILIEFEYHGLPGRQVKFYNVLFGYIFQVLNQRTQTITMCCDQYLIPSPQGKNNSIIQQGDNTDDRLLEACATRQQPGVYTTLARSLAKMAWIRTVN